MRTAQERYIHTESKESLLGRECYARLGPVGVTQYVKYAAENHIPLDGSDLSHATVHMPFGQLLETFSGYFGYEGVFLRHRISFFQDDGEVRLSPDTELMFTLSPDGDRAIKERLYGRNPFNRGGSMEVSMPLSMVGNLLGRVPNAFDSDITLAADPER